MSREEQENNPPRVTKDSGRDIHRSTWEADSAGSRRRLVTVSAPLVVWMIALHLVEWLGILALWGWLR